MMENSQVSENEKSPQELSEQLSEELAVLEKRYSRTMQENEQLREAVYHMEVQSENSEQKHKDERERLSEVIVQLGHKVRTLESLNNHLMNEEEEMIEHESSLVKQNDEMKTELALLKTKLAAEMEEVKTLKSQYWQETKYLRCELEHAEEIILNMEGEKAKQDAQIAQHESLIDELYTLMESLRGRIKDLKRQLEANQEERIMLGTGSESIKDEFDAIGESIDPETTQDSAVQCQPHARSVTAEKSTHTESTASTLKWTQTKTLSLEPERPEAPTLKWTQTETMSLEPERPKASTLKWTQTKSMSLEPERPEAPTLKWTQTKSMSLEPERPEAPTLKWTQTETMSLEPERPEAPTQKGTQTETLTSKPRQPKCFADKSTQTDPLTAPKQKSWWGTCVKSLIFIGKYAFLSVLQAVVVTKAYEMANNYCAVQSEVPV